MKIKTSFLTMIFLLAAAGLTAEEPIKYVETGIDPNSWVLVPAGDFFAGQHQHVETIDHDFEIMVTDVTNQQYAEYLNAALAAGTVYMKNDTIWGSYPGDPFDGYLHEWEIPAGDYRAAPE